MTNTFNIENLNRVIDESCKYQESCYNSIAYSDKTIIGFMVLSIIDNGANPTRNAFNNKADSLVFTGNPKAWIRKRFNTAKMLLDEHKEFIYETLESTRENSNWNGFAESIVRYMDSNDIKLWNGKKATQNESESESDGMTQESPKTKSDERLVADAVALLMRCDEKGLVEQVLALYSQAKSESLAVAE